MQRSKKQEISGHSLHNQSVLMFNLSIAQSMTPEDSRRYFAVKYITFEIMVKVLKPCWRSTLKRGVLWRRKFSYSPFY
jgi:hypothetical protein